MGTATARLKTLLPWLLGAAAALATIWIARTQLVGVRDASASVQLRQCQVAYGLVLRQLIEHAVIGNPTADTPLFTGLQIIEAQNCAGAPFRDTLPAQDGVDRLRGLAAGPRPAYEAALYGLLEHTAFAVDSDRADPLATTTPVTRVLFPAAMPVLTGLARGSEPPREPALAALSAAPEPARDGPLQAPARAYGEALGRLRRAPADAAGLHAAVAYARERLCALYDAAAVQQHQALQGQLEALALRRKLVLSAAGVVLLMLLGAAVLRLLALARERDRKLDELVQASRRTAHGEYGVAVSAGGSGKVSELGTAFNEMAAELRRGYQQNLDTLENERRAAVAARRYLNDLAGAIPGAVFELASHDDGRYSLPFVSEGFRPLLGMAHGDARTPETLLLAAAHADDRAALAGALGGLSSSVEGFEHQFRLAADGGSTPRWLQMQASVPRSGADGSLRRFGQLSDLSRQKALEAALEEALEEARTAERFKSDFMRNVSHELRTPIIAVVGLSHLLLQKPQDAAQRESLTQISAAAKSLTGLVNNLLDFSRLEAGALNAVLEDFDLADVIEPLHAFAAPLTQAKGLDLAIEIDPGTPQALNGDAERIVQVLRAFLDNAVKFTARGSVTLDLRPVGAAGARVTLRFTVRDTGPGLDAAQRRQLFERVAQGDGSATRTQGGTGLGLVIARQLATLIGGQVGVDSRPGEGAAFWLELTLPVAAGRTARPLALAGVEPPSAVSEHQAAARAPYDAAALAALVAQIEAYDSEARDTLARLRGMQGAPDALLAQLDEHLAAFDFDAATALLPTLRTALAS